MLLALGFAPLGVIATSAVGGSAWMYSARDRAFFQELMSHGAAFEVLAHPEHACTAWFEKSWCGPILVLRTTFDNGSVAETTSMPGRAPDLTIATLFMALLGSRKWLRAGIWSMRFRHRFAHGDTAAMLNAHLRSIDGTRVPRPQTLTQIVAACDAIHRKTVFAALPRLILAMILLNVLLRLILG